MTTKLTDEQMNTLIGVIHEIWYKGDIIRNREDALQMHHMLSHLFNHAGITSTTVENNPEEATPEQWARHLERVKRMNKNEQVRTN
jgi:hypothetical protein